SIITHSQTMWNFNWFSWLLKCFGGLASGIAESALHVINIIHYLIVIRQITFLKWRIHWRIFFLLGSVIHRFNFTSPKFKSLSIFTASGKMRVFLKLGCHVCMKQLVFRKEYCIIDNISSLGNTNFGKLLITFFLRSKVVFYLIACLIAYPIINSIIYLFIYFF